MRNVVRMAVAEWLRMGGDLALYIEEYVELLEVTGSVDGVKIALGMSQSMMDEAVKAGREFCKKGQR